MEGFDFGKQLLMVVPLRLQRILELFVELFVEDVHFRFDFHDHRVLGEHFLNLFHGRSDRVLRRLLLLGGRMHGLRRAFRAWLL